MMASVRRASSRLDDIYWLSPEGEVKLGKRAARRRATRFGPGSGSICEGESGMSSPNETMETTEVVTTRPTPREPRATARIDFAAMSDPGKVRTNNEDHYLINRLSRSFGIVSTNMP